MTPLPNDPEPPRRGATSLLTVSLALIPPLALTLGIPFVNRLEPRIFGLPFLLAWIVAWILLTPVFMAVVYRVDRRRPR